MLDIEINKYIIYLVFVILMLFFSKYSTTLLVILKKWNSKKYHEMVGKVTEYREYDISSDSRKCIYVVEYNIDKKRYKFGFEDNSFLCKDIKKFKYNIENPNDILILEDITNNIGYLIVNAIAIGGVLVLFFKSINFLEVAILALLCLVVYYLIFVFYKKRNIKLIRYNEYKDFKNKCTIYKHYIRYYFDNKKIEEKIVSEIKQNDEKFSLELFKHNALIYLKELQLSCINNDDSRINNIITNNFNKEYSKYILDDLGNCNFEISNSNILNYKIENNNEVLGYQITIEWNIANEKIFTTYYMEFVRKLGIKTVIDNNSIVVKCPYCGASSDKCIINKCEYCGKFFSTSESTWALNNFCYGDEV